MDEIRDELNEIIQKLCTSGTQILDTKLMNDLKSICRQNDLHIEICFNLLISEFKKQHSEIRYSAFQITDYLFQRSCRFRDLILDDFQTFIEYIFDINKEKPLPPPKKAANDLKKLAAITVKKWHDKYAEDYKILDLGFNYLKNCKKIDFVQFNHQSVAERRNTEAILKKKEVQCNILATKAIEMMNEKENDIRYSLEQIDRCFNILIPKPTELFNDDDFQVATTSRNSEKNETVPVPVNNDDSDTDDDDFVEVKLPGDKYDEEEELRYLGFLNGRDSDYTRNFQIKIDLKLNENEDNRILVDIIKDLYKELKYSHLDNLNNWIKSFSSVKNATEHLKRAIELKNSIQSSIKSVEALGLNLDELKPKNKQAADKLDKPVTSGSKKRSSDDAGNEVDERKKKLLEIAPVFNLDEIQLGVAVSSKVEVANPFIQPNEINPSKEIVPTLAKKVFIGTFEPVKWKCRAPLANGKLCERMDRYKCPFHGKIIGRDKTGKATNEDEEKLTKVNKKDEYNPLGDKSLLADIEAQTGKDLGSKGKKRRKNSKKGNLTDLNAHENTTHKRLERMLCNSKSLRRIGGILDSIERRQHHERFHHNFNYSVTQ